MNKKYIFLFLIKIKLIYSAEQNQEKTPLNKLSNLIKLAGISCSAIYVIKKLSKNDDSFINKIPFLSNFLLNNNFLETSKKLSFACLSLSLCIDSVNELKNKNFLESIFPIATLSIATGLMRAFDEEMQDYILYAITLIALLDAISL